MSQFIIKITIAPPGQPGEAWARTAVVDYTDPADLETMANAFINTVKSQGNPTDA